MIDLDKLERLEKAASPSPWSIAMAPPHGFGQTVYCENNSHPVGDFDDDPSASFLVELRNAAPALFAELRRLRAIEAAARAYCDLTPDRADETPAPLLFAKLQAAVAAKEASA